MDPHQWRQRIVGLSAAKDALTVCQCCFLVLKPSKLPCEHVMTGAKDCASQLSTAAGVAETWRLLCTDAVCNPALDTTECDLCGTTGESYRHRARFVIVPGSEMDAGPRSEHRREP